MADAGTPLASPKIVPSVDYREYAQGLLTESGFALNTTAAYVFKCCDGLATPSEIAEGYARHFGVDSTAARTDVDQVLEMLVENNLVER